LEEQRGGGSGGVGGGASGSGLLLLRGDFELPSPPSEEKERGTNSVNNVSVFRSPA
jgi:hypothetical protein